MSTLFANVLPPCGSTKTSSIGKTTAIAYVFGNVEGRADEKCILFVANPPVVAAERCFAPLRRFKYVPKRARKQQAGCCTLEELPLLFFSPEQRRRLVVFVARIFHHCVHVSVSCFLLQGKPFGNER